MCGGGVATPSDALDMLQFTAEEIRAITTIAKQSKTYVTAHAYTVDAIRHAIYNDIQGIEHGNFIEETATYCKEKGVIFTPILATYQGITQAQFDQFLDEFGQKKNREVLASGLGALKILQKAGAIICFASDFLEILQSAIINAARYLGKEGELGCIKTGNIADILILKVNPLDDIAILDRI
ncbi:hypothetical protein LT330_000812 [Penicillium expansum]|nr:hypothetical protein LT330_000812 [Penicillium expansum]